MNVKALKAIVRREYRSGFVAVGKGDDLTTLVIDGFAGFCVSPADVPKVLDGITRDTALEVDGSYVRYSAGNKPIQFNGRLSQVFRDATEAATEELELTNLAHYNDEYGTVGRFLRFPDGRFVVVNQQYLACLGDAKYLRMAYRDYTFWGCDTNKAVVVKDKYNTVRAVIMPIVGTDVNAMAGAASLAAEYGKAA